MGSESIIPSRRTTPSNAIKNRSIGLVNNHSFSLALLVQIFVILCARHDLFTRTRSGAYA